MSVSCWSKDFKRAECSCVAPKPPSGPIIGGYGDFRYQYMPNLLELPEGTEVIIPPSNRHRHPPKLYSYIWISFVFPYLNCQIQHAHGLEVDADGRIYLTYVNWNNGIQTNGTDTHCLVRWDADGTNGVYMDLGGTELCNGTPHGLKIAKENNELFLYHANCGTRPPRFDLASNPVLSTVFRL